MAETLGAQILDAAAEHSHRPPGEAATRAAWERLRALAARADAAERVAVALGGLVGELSAKHEREMSGVHRRLYAGPCDAIELARATEALTAWRAINGEVDG